MDVTNGVFSGTLTTGSGSSYTTTFYIRAENEDATPTQNGPTVDSYTLIGTGNSESYF